MVDLQSLVGGGSSAYPAGYLWGLTLKNGTDAVNDIDIAAGICRDRADTGNLALTSILTKQLDAAWAVGTNAGGLDQGSIANATYHEHLIKRTDTGVVDAIYSLSHDVSATVTMTIASPGVVTWGVAGAGHGLVSGSPFKFSTTGALPTGVTTGTQYYVISTGLAETTFQFAATNGGSAINTSGSQSGVHTGQPGPLLPTNYTLFRRIGSIVRSSASIVGFSQKADEFVLNSPVLDVDATQPTNNTAITRTLTVPLGVKLKALLTVSSRGQTGQSNMFSYLSSLDSADIAVSTTVAPYMTVGLNPASAGDEVFAPAAIWTNTSGQIRSRSTNGAGTTTHLGIVTNGWIDNRGRLN